MKTILHKETLGVTEPALKALRDEILKRYDHKLAIAQVPAIEHGGHSEGYGFAIFDETMEHIIIIGDGFRADGGGTGGAGHRAAQSLIHLMGLKVCIVTEPIEFDEDIALGQSIIDVMRTFTRVPIDEKPEMRITYLYRSA